MEQWIERIQGIPNNPPLYADNYLVVTLLVCFFILSAVLSDKDGFISDILKGFFLPRENSENSPNTTMRKLYMHIGMLLVSFISGALLLSVYVSQSKGLNLPDIRLTGTFFAAIIALYVIKQGLFWIVNWIFFDRQQTALWYSCYSNWLSLSGIPLYICILFSVFMNWSACIIAWTALIELSFMEIGLFFRAFHIFLTKRHGSLQLFVYLCTLEVMPLLFIGKALILYI